MIQTSRSATLIALAVFLSMLVPAIGEGSKPAEEYGRAISPADVEYMKYININGYEFDPLQGIPDLPESLRFDSEKTPGLAYYLVQFDRPITKSMKDDLSSTGATILDYVSYNAFVVRANRATIELAESLPVVRWAGLFEPAYKLSPRLAESYDQVVDDLLRGPSGGTAYQTLANELDDMLSSIVHTPDKEIIPVKVRRIITVEISVFEEWNLPLVLDSIERLGGKGIQYSYQSSGIIRADMERGSLAEVAHELGVMWIERYMPKTLYNDIACWVVQSGDTISHATPVHEHGIWGTGQIVTLADSGIDYQHNAFEDPAVSAPGPTHRKVTDYYIPSDAWGDGSDQGGNHGTHTSATVAGDDGVWHVYDGNFSGSNMTIGPHDGIAFDATIQVQDISEDGHFVFPPTDFRDMYQEALDRGSWIHSNSWGSSGATYNLDASSIDDFIWNNQEFLIIHSAGNSGSYFGALGNQAAAKNLLAVGATYNGAMMDDIAGFSSRGPAEDGRLKPDIMAPGVDTWSALGGDPDGETDLYIQYSGTSMAAPTVAGSCALIRQYYMDGWYPTGTAQLANAFTPSAALIKATIINGAAEMTGNGAYDMGEEWYPNNSQGWGRATLDDSLYFLGDSRRLMAYDERLGLSTGETATYQIAVGNPSAPLEITLAWSDYPGTTYSSPNLVNDLDLVVRGPDGTVYFGNTYEGFNPGESEKNPSEHDHLNNVEGVLVLTDLQIGIWTIEVTGFNTPVGPQPYALVVTGETVTEMGVVSLDRDIYRSDDIVTVLVCDTGLDADPESVDTSYVLLSSTTESTPENITVVETGDSTSVFRATVALDLSASPVPEDGVLQVQNLDLISVSYYDNDDGSGGADWTADFASIDDDPPVISDVTVNALRAKGCKIVWNTSEPSNSTVLYGTGIPLNSSVSSSSLTNIHEMSLTGLTENDTYYFAVESTDEAGNYAYDDNGSAYYTFRTPPIPPVQPPSSEWPTYQNNPARLGSSPSAMYPPLELMWSSGPYSEEYGLFSSPIVSEGVLVSATTDGYLRGWNPYSGDCLWTEMIADNNSYLYMGTPTAMEGVVFICYSEIDLYTYEVDRRASAFDIHTGEPIWSVDLAAYGISLASYMNLACDGDMIVGGGTSVFALAIDDGSVLWHQTEADSPYGVSIAHGLVYANSRYHSYAIHALDNQTGDVVWSTDLGSSPIGVPCVTGDTAYVLTNSGVLYAIDAFNGDALWQTIALGSTTIGTPTCNGNMIFVATLYGGVYAINAFDGSIIWEISTYEAETPTIAHADGYLFRTSPLTGLVVHDASNGTIMYTYPLEGVVASSPAVSDGWVWVIDYSGSLYAFHGLSPVGLMVSPSSQTVETATNSTVEFCIEVENYGYLGEDVFDIELTPGVQAWETGIFAADGETPLVDTDGDTMIDTGPLQPYESFAVSIIVSVPANASGGDSDETVLRLLSSSDSNISMCASVEALVPLPGASIGPSKYAAVDPGEAMTATMQVRNDGGCADTIDIGTISANNWDMSLFAADGSTLLTDTDGDDLPDVGILNGLNETTIVVELSAPIDVGMGGYDEITVTALSSLNPYASDFARIVAEVGSFVSDEWPTLGHDVGRTGISPVDYELPLTFDWSTPEGGSPVVSDRMVYYASGDGDLNALDVSSGDMIWTVMLGWYGPGYAGSPSVSGEMVYVTLSNSSGYPAIYAVDKYSGELRWSYEADTHGQGYHQISTPVVALGSVYWAITADGTVYANDALTGDLKWQSSTTGEYGGAGPTYWKGMLFATDAYYGITAFDALTGEVVWKRQDFEIFSAPVVTDEILYAFDLDGGIWAINPFDGETIWARGGSYLFHEPLAFRPLCVNDILFAEVELNWSDFSMRALDALTGDVLWTDSLTYSWHFSSPVYSNGIVYAIAEGETICAWNATTGEVLLTQDLVGGVFYSSVIMSDGYLIVDSSPGLEAYGFKGVGTAVSTNASPDPLVLSIGEAKTVEAVAYDVFGNPAPEAVFEWESLDGMGAIVPMTEYGGVVAYMAGSVSGTDTLQYTHGSLSGTIEVEIRPGNATWMAIEPREVSIAPGEIISFSATVRDEFGNECPNIDIVWSASESAGAIDEDGSLVASTVVGTGMVIAQLGNLSASATVTILPGELAAITASPQSATVTVGSSLTIETAASDAFGNALSSVNMEWSSSTGTILPTGDYNECAVLIAPTYPGSVMVTVSSNGLAANVAVQVVAGALDRIVLSPSPITIHAGESVTIEALWEDSYGNDLEEKLMEWTHSIGDLTVGDDGLSAELHAGSVPGQGVVTASYDNVTESVTVTVLESEPRFSSGESILIASAIVAAVAAILIALFILRRRKGPSATDISPPVEQPPTT